MLRLDGLSYALGANTLLAETHAQIGQGQFWLICGPNGAGKTTLLRLVNHLLQPTTGTVQFLSRPLPRFSRRELATHMAYLPQNEEFALPITVEHVLLSGRRPYKSWLGDYATDDWEQVRAIAREFSLEHLLAREMHTLSGGERKKVLIASAIIQNVEVILMDEPLAFLDPAAALQCLRMLNGLHKQGKTLLLVSHQLELLYPHVTHMLALNHNRLIYAGEKTGDTAVLQQTYGVHFEKLTFQHQEIVLPYDA